MQNSIPVNQKKFRRLRREFFHSHPEALALYYSEGGLSYRVGKDIFPVEGFLLLSSPELSINICMSAGSNFGGEFEFLWAGSDLFLSFTDVNGSTYFFNWPEEDNGTPSFAVLSKVRYGYTAALFFYNSSLKLPVIAMAEPYSSSRPGNISPLFSVLRHAYFSKEVAHEFC